MTNPERIAYHKEEMLKRDSQERIKLPTSTSKARYDKYPDIHYTTYKISTYDLHEHLIKLIENKDFSKYNLQVMQCLCDFPADLLFNLVPLTWTSIMPVGEYKGRQLKEVPLYRLVWYIENNVILVDNKVLYYTLFSKGLIEKTITKKQTTTNNFYAGSSWDNLNSLEVDSWGGCCPNM